MIVLDDLETYENGISGYPYPLEHCNALGEPKSIPSVIKFDHLANNKVIIITKHEIWGQTLKTKTTILVLGMSRTNISKVFFMSLPWEPCLTWSTRLTKSKYTKYK